MTSVNRTYDRFSCPECGLTYRGVKEPFPFARAGRFDCIGCTTEVHAWSGNYDYVRWEGLHDPQTPLGPQPACQVHYRNCDGAVEGNNELNIVQPL
jgi:hypothetical protein